MLDPGLLHALAAKATIDAQHLDDTCERLLAIAPLAGDYAEAIGRIVIQIRRAAYTVREAGRTIAIVADKTREAVNG